MSSPVFEGSHWAWRICARKEGATRVQWKQKHNLISVAEGRLQVLFVLDAAVVVRIAERLEPLLRDTVFEPPLVANLLTQEVFQKKYEDIPTKCVVKDVIAGDIHMVMEEEYVIDGIVNHSNEGGNWMLRVMWYEFASAKDTLDSIEGLPCSSEMRCLRVRPKLELLPRDPA